MQLEFTDTPETNPEITPPEQKNEPQIPEPHGDRRKKKIIPKDELCGLSDIHLTECYRALKITSYLSGEDSVLQSLAAFTAGSKSLVLSDDSIEPSLFTHESGSFRNTFVKSISALPPEGRLMYAAGAAFSLAANDVIESAVCVLKYFPRYSASLFELLRLNKYMQIPLTVIFYEADEIPFAAAKAFGEKPYEVKMVEFSEDISSLKEAFASSKRNKRIKIINASLSPRKPYFKYFEHTLLKHKVITKDDASAELLTVKPEIKNYTLPINYSQNRFQNTDNQRDDYLDLSAEGLHYFNLGCGIFSSPYESDNKDESYEVPSVSEKEQRDEAAEMEELQNTPLSEQKDLTGITEYFQQGEELTLLILSRENNEINFNDFDIDVINVTGLNPEFEKIEASVYKTGKVFIVYKPEFEQVSYELSAQICETLFQSLDAPVQRLLITSETSEHAFKNVLNEYLAF